MKTFLFILFATLFAYSLFIWTQQLKVNQRDTDEMPQEYREDPKLGISGSAQFSVKQFKRLVQRLPENATIVDLRMESHGFQNGDAISWYSKHNWKNLNKRATEIAEDEKNRLEEISGLSEEALVTSHGLNYYRIYVPDHHHPTEEQLLELFDKIPKSTWIHFHCQAGLGRTSSFMILYDIFYNAQSKTFEEIIAHQHTLGGKNFFKHPKKDHWVLPYYEAHLAFLKSFYTKMHLQK